MNAGLQCLCHIEPFAAFFLSGRYKQEVNTSNPLGNGGDLARAFAELMQLMWQNERSKQDPSRVRQRLARIAPHLFEGYAQQDVHEFLAFCLDGLHEDLNRVVVKPPPPTEKEETEFERAAASRSEEFAAALSWMRYLQRGKSFLVDLMQGQLRSKVTCTVCKYESKRFEPFLYLSVPVCRGMRTLNDALDLYLQEECLEGDEQWYCEKCKQRVDARKKIDIWKLPTILVLHLKRFEYDARRQRFRKIDTKLVAGEQLDFTEYCSSDQLDGALFDVVSVANHIGPYGHGHYTATCRIMTSEGAPSWYYFDDERVSPVSSKDAIGREAYVIFFARRAPGGGDDESSDGLGDSDCDNACLKSGCAASKGAVVVRRQTVRMPHLWPHRNSVVERLVADLELGFGTLDSVTKAGANGTRVQAGSSSRSSPASASSNRGATGGRRSPLGMLSTVEPRVSKPASRVGSPSPRSQPSSSRSRPGSRPGTPVSLRHGLPSIRSGEGQRPATPPASPTTRRCATKKLFGWVRQP